MVKDGILVLMDRPAKIKGAHSNILDDHPLNAIWRVKDAIETAMKR